MAEWQTRLAQNQVSPEDVGVQVSLSAPRQPRWSVPATGRPATAGTGLAHTRLPSRKGYAGPNRVGTTVRYTPSLSVSFADVVKWQTRQLEGLVGFNARGGSSPLVRTNLPA